VRDALLQRDRFAAPEQCARRGLQQTQVRSVRAFHAVTQDQPGKLVAVRNRRGRGKADLRRERRSPDRNARFHRQALAQGDNIQARIVQRPGESHDAALYHQALPVPACDALLSESTFLTPAYAAVKRAEY